MTITELGARSAPSEIARFLLAKHSATSNSTVNSISQPQTFPQDWDH